MERDLLTALPYVDAEGPGPVVQGLIEAEMRTFTPVNYLEGHSTATLTFEASELLRKEWDAMQSSNGSRKLGVIDLTRYTVPPPPPSDNKSVTAWEEAVKNAKAMLVHQSTHAENLELLKLYGANAWRDCNEKLEQLRSRLQNEVNEAQKQLDKLNLDRKNEQLPVGRKLVQLEDEWSQLVERNRALARAISNLEQELVTLQRTVVS
jgi:hypothetical protein